MTENGLQIEGTPYFKKIDGCLRRMLRVQLPSAVDGGAQVGVSFGDESYKVEVKIISGVIDVIGPEYTLLELNLHITVQTDQGSWEGSMVLSPTRLWTIYIAQDKHLDYGWIHPVEKVVERINNLTDYYLEAADKTDLHWNFDTSIWVDEYLSARPSYRQEKLLSRLRSGHFEMAALWLTPSPGIMGTEEALQMLMASRRLRDAGVPVHTAMLQEAPSLPWGLATVLAGAGIPYVVKGGYDLRNPHFKELEAYPLTYWEGPDGSRVLLRWDLYADAGKWGGYGEGYVFWRSDSRDEKVKYVESTIRRYESYSQYPFDAILLAGTGFDEYPQNTAVNDFIHWFNGQGYEYPRLVDATWERYWQAVEKQIDQVKEKIPVVRGDWGTAWEEWPAQMARLNTLYRQARATVLSAQAVTALAYGLDPQTGTQRKDALASAWRSLLQFDEHDFGGITPSMAEDTHETKAGYAHAALREGRRALESSVAVLAANVQPYAGDGRGLLVVNPNSWVRDGVVEVVVQDNAPYEVLDLHSGQTLPCQIDTYGMWKEHYLSFMASEVPSYGYRRYLVRRGSTPIRLSEPVPSASTYENDHYRLKVNEKTGGLESCIEKSTGREWVNASDGLALNEYIHHSDGSLHRSTLVAVTLREGKLFDALVTESTCLRTKLTTTYKIYHADQRLEIVNELYKESSFEPQASWFAFPLNIKDPLYSYDGPAAVLHAGPVSQGGDLLPGSGISSTATQSFLAASDPSGTMVIASPDAYLFQFGRQVLETPVGDSDFQQSLALSLPLHNFTRNDFIVNQSGQNHFVFRYSLSYSPGPFSAGAALRFGRAAAQDLPKAWEMGSGNGSLPYDGSFIGVAPENIQVTGLKLAEDGQGYVMRLWECEGHACDVLVNLSGLNVTQAWKCDLLEEKQVRIDIKDDRVEVPIKARGLIAIRFE